MSQASKHVEWCINKAEKEIEECKKLGKKIKHRGLIKVKPNVEEAKKHIDKAEHNFNAITRCQEPPVKDGWHVNATLVLEHCQNSTSDSNHPAQTSGILKFKEIGFSDWSISAGFYCIYQCFLAIALKFGFESRNQICTVALIEHLKEDGKINIDAKFIEMLKYEEAGEIEDKIIEMREDYTYGVEISFKNEQKINNLMKTCREMIDATKEIVFKA